MNRSDPTSFDIGVLTSAELEEEVTVEDVAQLQQIDLTAQSPAVGEPTTAPSAEAGAAPQPAAAPASAILPIRIRYRQVSGRYRSGGGGFQLELRVDVDGRRPTRRVSGDFFQVSGGTVTYFGSFVVNSPTVVVTSTAVVLDGLGTFTWTAAAPRVRLTVQRRPITVPPGLAQVQYLTLSGQAGAQYLCQFVSRFFRTVRLEQDCVSDAGALFDKYNTGSLPSGGSARDLSVVSAFTEAGIEIQPTTGTNVIPNTEAGASWDDSELHASMERHFSLWRDLPQWAVWEVACLRYVDSNVLGIMFDQQGRQRQGCAVFQERIGGNAPDKLRYQLYTYVHELGHCFNMLHSWQKSLAIPPGADRPNAVSYMNYPQLYPGGSTAFWSAFPFQFDDGELVHLRHAFRNNIIMGGNNFRFGSGLDDSAFQEPVEDNSGLRLTLSMSRRSLAFGEPVLVNLRLTTTDERGRISHPYLHPDTGLVQIGICKPDGTVVAYRPLIAHCVTGQETRVDASNPFTEDAIYCGFGKDGFYFDRTGWYQLRAVYTALDGSKVYSNILNLRVRHPSTVTDEEAAELMFGQDQGTLLYLKGSDSETLKRGNDAFELLIQKHPKHVLADYARWIKGTNAARRFKIIGLEKVDVRAENPQDAVQLLTPVLVSGERAGTALAAAATGGVMERPPVEPTAIDPILVESVAAVLANAQRTIGDTSGAAQTEKRIRRKVRAPKAA